MPERGGAGESAPPGRFVADFLGPEHDTADRAWAGPRETYVICSTPRSGSGLLCRGLAGTGALATPLEYLNPVHRGILSERWRCASDLDSYVEALHSRRTAMTGLFGVRVHWDQMVQVRAEEASGISDRFVAETSAALFERLFPTSRFIRILRLDLGSSGGLVLAGAAFGRLVCPRRRVGSAGDRGNPV